MDSEPDIAPTVPAEPEPAAPAAAEPEPGAPQPLLSAKDLSTIETTLDGWRAAYKNGDRQLANVRDYSLHQALEQMLALEEDVRQCTTATLLKGAVETHIKMAGQVRWLMSKSSLTADEIKKINADLRGQALAHMVACDLVAARALKMSDRRALIQISMQLRAIVADQPGVRR